MQVTTQAVLALACACAALYSCGGIDAGSAPFITPCHASDSACLKSSAQKAVPALAAGVPALALQTLDPMHIALVKADQAGLQIEFRETVVKGLRNCVVLSLKRQDRKQTVELKCSVVLIGNYTIGGKLLIMPVQGNGKYKIKISDIVVKVQYETGEKMQKGEKYWTVPSWKYTSEVKTGAEFQFQNLFNGNNKELAEQVIKFANENWREIFQEVAPPIVKAIVSKIVDEVTKLFNSVPIRELALD